MPLSTMQVDTAAIEKICQLDDDVYRNKWITHVYFVLSDRLRKLTGENNATWFTFARWSSYTVGENLRFDQPSAAFQEFLDRHPPLGMWPVRQQLTRLQLDLRRLSDAAMPRTLAMGNRLVFHEIAYAVSAFLDWYEAIGTPTLDEWVVYRDTIKGEPASDLFPTCDVNLFRDGIEAYYLASRERDERVKARLVLTGNVRLAAYEQWRLQPIVDIALDPMARHLVKFRNTNRHKHGNDDKPTAVLRHRGTPWAFRHRSPMTQWVSERYADYLTQHVMAWEGEVDGERRNLFLGAGVPRPSVGGPMSSTAVQGMKNSDTLVVAMFDRSHGKQRDTRAKNWASYSDRMNFIVNLFQSRQHDPTLFTPPHGRGGSTSRSRSDRQAPQRSPQARRRACRRGAAEARCRQGAGPAHVRPPAHQRRVPRRPRALPRRAVARVGQPGPPEPGTATFSARMAWRSRRRCSSPRFRTATPRHAAHRSSPARRS